MPIPAAPLAIALGLAYGVRRLAARRHERAFLRRVSRGADGIVVGAEPVAHEGDGRGAVLLLHGFGDTPQTVRELAASLAARGWTTRAPLLAGHGRSLRDFARSGAEDWIAGAREELQRLRERHDAVHLVGLSMGGAIASVLAAEAAAEARETHATTAGAIRSLTLLSPYVEMPRDLRRIARAHWVYSLFVPYAAGRSERSIHDAEAAARTLGYGMLTPRLLRELLRVVERARPALPRVAVPTLWIQSHEDNRLTPEAARLAFATIGAAEKRQEWLRGCGHVITVDFQREQVTSLVAAWLESHAGDTGLRGALAPARPAGSI